MDVKTIKSNGALKINLKSLIKFFNLVEIAERKFAWLNLKRLPINVVYSPDEIRTSPLTYTYVYHDL